MAKLHPRLFTVSALMATSLFSPVANAARVRIESTPGIDFAKYKTYTWRDHPVFQKQPQLAELYSVGIQLVKNAGNQNLMGRGFESTRDNPDFFITFFFSGQQKQDVDVVYDSGAYGWGGWYGW